MVGVFHCGALGLAVGILNPAIGVFAGISCGTVYITACDTWNPSSLPKRICKPVKVSCDPNDIVGPDGYSDEQWVGLEETLPYTIRFENDPELASAPAQVVSIRHPLDPAVDLRTFRLGRFGFGPLSFDPPANASYYTTRVDATDSLGVMVDVAAGVDVVANEAFWNFTTIDPKTGDQPGNDPTVGFLPVNDAAGNGEGFVSYTVKANADAETGDVIDAQADIVFDINAPLATPSVFNTVDSDPPISALDVLAGRQDSSVFQIRWSGRDEGSGIRDYTLYSSKDGAPFEPIRTAITDTAYLFVGELGHRYRFYTVATDNAGNVEPSKSDGQLVIVDVEADEPAGVPKEFALHQNYPNPFNPSTTIPFDLPERGQVEFVLYDILGRRVLSIDKGDLQPGKYQHLLDLSNFASGVYLYQIIVKDESRMMFTDVGKLVLVK